MTLRGANLIAFYLSPDRLPAQRQWSREHAHTQRRLCERFAAPAIGAVLCQDITTGHMQKIVNAASTPGEGGRVQGMISALVSTGLEGGYLASPRLARVHWQAAGRRFPRPRSASPASRRCGSTSPRSRPIATSASRAGHWSLGICTWSRRRTGKCGGPSTPGTTPGGYRLADRIEQVRAEQAAGSNPPGLVFPSPTGKHWRSSNFSRNVLKVAYLAVGWRDAAGRGAWTWHSLRHMFCTTALFTWKLDATDVSRMAGHANYRITLDMYVGTTAGVLDRARTATQ
jgi:hypothetical protein